MSTLVISTPAFHRSATYKIFQRAGIPTGMFIARTNRSHPLSSRGYAVASAWVKVLKRRET